MSDTQISDAVVSRIRKLLAMAASGSGATEAEAATAASMVQKLLTDYNVSLAEIGAGRGTGSDQREKTAHDKAAMYQYQRDLMAALARNNFCKWWTTNEDAFSFGKQRRVKRHVLLGRGVNVLTTRLTYDYLMETMDRLLPYQGMAKRGREALLWLAGCTERLTERLQAQREEAEAASARKAKEEARRARHPGAAPGTALALVNVYQNEDELNRDYVEGLEPGTTTRRRLTWEAQQAARRVEIEAKEVKLRAQGMPEEDIYYLARYDRVPDDVLESRRLAAMPAKPAKPERPETEAQRRKREQREANENYRYYRRYSREAERRSDPAYQAGAATGDRISLHRQVDHTSRERIK